MGRSQKSASKSTEHFDSATTFIGHNIQTHKMADAARAQITRGALNAIFNDPTALERQYPVPVCQCVQIKTLASNGDGAPERYRLVLSDVDNFVQSMLATQANHVVHEGKLKKGCIVRLKQYQANAVKGKRILIILDLEVIESLGELEKIGEPVALTVKDEADIKPTNTTIAGNGFYGNQPKPAPVAQERALRPMRTYTLSKACHRMPISGPSKLESRKSQISRPGRRQAVKESFSVSIFSMKVAKSRQPDSTSSVICSMILSRKARSTTSQIHVGSSSQS